MHQKNRFGKNSTVGGILLVCAVLLASLFVLPYSGYLSIKHKNSNDEELQKKGAELSLKLLTAAAVSVYGIIHGIQRIIHAAFQMALSPIAMLQIPFRTYRTALQWPLTKINPFPWRYYKTLIKTTTLSYKKNASSLRSWKTDAFFAPKSVLSLFVGIVGTVGNLVYAVALAVSSLPILAYSGVKNLLHKNGSATRHSLTSEWKMTGKGLAHFSIGFIASLANIVLSIALICRMPLRGIITGVKARKGGRKETHNDRGTTHAMHQRLDMKHTPDNHDSYDKQENDNNVERPLVRQQRRKAAKDPLRTVGNSDDEWCKPEENDGYGSSDNTPGM